MFLSIIFSIYKKLTPKVDQIQKHKHAINLSFTYLLQILNIQKTIKNLLKTSCLTDTINVYQLLS